MSSLTETPEMNCVWNCFWQLHDAQERTGNYLNETPNMIFQRPRIHLRDEQGLQEASEWQTSHLPALSENASVQTNPVSGMKNYVHVNHIVHVGFSCLLLTIRTGNRERIHYLSTQGKQEQSIRGHMGQFFQPREQCWCVDRMVVLGMLQTLFSQKLI